MSTHWTTCIVILILGFSAGYFAGTSHDQESTEIAIPSSGAAYDPSPQNPPSQNPKPKTLESSPQAIPELDAEPTPMVITASLYPVFSERDLEVVFDQLEEEQDLPALCDGACAFRAGPREVFERGAAAGRAKLPGDRAVLPVGRLLAAAGRGQSEQHQRGGEESGQVVRAGSHGGDDPESRCQMQDSAR